MRSVVRLLPLTLALTLAAGAARAGSLEQPDDVDLVQLDPATRQLQLLVILDEDHVDTRQAMGSLWRKLIHYQRYIASGRALKESSNANAGLRPAVVIFAPMDASSGEMQNLAGVKMALDQRGAEVLVQPYLPGLHARPRRIAP